MLKRTKEPRQHRNVAYMWADKRILRYFRKNFSHTDYKNLKAVYLALAEMDSDFGEGMPINNLTQTCAAYAGVERNIASRYMQMLRDQGLINYVQQNKNGVYGHSYLILYSFDGLSRSMENHITESRSMGNRITGNHTTVKNITSSKEEVLTTFYKKEEIKEERKNGFTDFLSLFPEEFRLNKDFYRAARHFYSYRRDLHGKFVDRSQKLIANKLHGYSVEVAIAAFESAIESGWTSVWPKPTNGSNGTNGTKPRASAAEIINHYFGHLDERCMKECLNRIIPLANGTPDTKLAAKLGGLFDYCAKHQRRPLYEIPPRQGDIGYGTYCNWRDLIPTPYGIVRRYIDWILKNDKLTTISDAILTPENKYFMWFIADLREQISCDPFSGASV